MAKNHLGNDVSAPFLRQPPLAAQKTGCRTKSRPAVSRSFQASRAGPMLVSSARSAAGIWRLSGMTRCVTFWRTKSHSECFVLVCFFPCFKVGQRGGPALMLHKLLMYIRCGLLPRSEAPRSLFFLPCVMVNDCPPPPVDLHVSVCFRTRRVNICTKVFVVAKTSSASSRSRGRLPLVLREVTKTTSVKAQLQLLTPQEKDSTVKVCVCVC